MTGYRRRSLIESNLYLNKKIVAHHSECEDSHDLAVSLARLKNKAASLTQRHDLVHVDHFNVLGR
jgi:hypothetical protein